jgi:serine/threonine-protein phosphatase 2A regulatory subunit A
VEETLVRDKAAESISTVSTALSPEQIDEHFIPLLRRLGKGDWFTSRTSSAGLMAAAYPIASPAAQEEMRRLFAGLCQDDTPMVRRAASRHLAVSRMMLCIASFVS